MRHVVQYSGGAGSWLAAKRVVERYGTRDVTLLFADVLMEDESLYDFLHATSRDLGLPVIRLSDGRNPWQVFNDVGFMANSRVDPCSKILKRDLLWSHIEATYDPANTIIYLGIDWSEEHRLVRAAKRRAPWVVAAPLCDPPYLVRDDIEAELKKAGIKMPRLYELGFIHNNCGGFCIKAGQAQFKLLLETMPERYAWHEEQEQRLRERLGKDVAIMRDRRGGDRPLTMKALRERVEAETDDTDPTDIGGCGCAVD